MCGSRQFCQRGSNYGNLFLSLFFVHGGEGENESNATVCGSSSTRLRNAINIDCWLCSFVIFQGIQTSIAKKPYICDFSSGGPKPHVHSLWIRACLVFFFYFFALGLYDTSYLNMQHLGVGLFFVLTRVFVRFQQCCTLEASLKIFWNSIGSLRQTLY